MLMRGASTLETTSHTSIRSHLPSGILKKPLLAEVAWRRNRKPKPS